MKPGIKLDELIAEKVFGWEKTRNAFGNGWDLPYISNKFKKEGRRTWVRNCPKYSTDISASWEVVEKIRKLDEGEDFVLECVAHDGRWRCECANKKLLIRAIEIGFTAPHAICLVALKVLNVRHE